MARYFRRGLSKIKFAPAVAGTSPTRAEITAGTDLSVDLAAINGFALANTPIMTPDLSTTFNTQIPGEDAAAASSLEFYDQDNATTIRTALAKGTAGFILLFPYGDIVGKRVEKWPATSTGVNDRWDLAADAGKFQVDFSVTAVPVQNGVTPA